MSRSFGSNHSSVRGVGFPVAPEKTEGQTTITFLGIEIDSQVGQLRLPQEKLVHLLAIVKQWMRQGNHLAPHSSGKKRDLLSLIGLLHHASSVVRPGRALFVTSSMRLQQ